MNQIIMAEMDDLKLHQLREEYALSSLDELDVNKDPFTQFRKWFKEAKDSKILEPNAMTLSTVDEEIRPHSRIVLLKELDESGLIFFTNYSSDKGQEMGQNKNVSVSFFWGELQRQIIVNGTVQKIPKHESEAYFKSRPYASQIGALASNQSEVIENREVLNTKFKKLEEQFSEGEVPMPEQWGGYRITPNYFEFWQGRRSRLHDRIVFNKEKEEWLIKRLSP